MDSAWAWRIGSSHNHGGYQNPLAAWALSPAGPAALRPQSPTAAADWNTSLTRQVQFYAWLQSAEGAIAGGATNSWDGAYAARPAGAPQFFGMSYDVDPVYHDPPSNQWFGFQAWGMQRLAELYYVLPDGATKTLAKSVLDKWVAWAISPDHAGHRQHVLVPERHDLERCAGGDLQQRDRHARRPTRACTCRWSTAATTSVWRRRTPVR